MTRSSLEDRILGELPDVRGIDVTELARVLERLVAALRPEQVWVFGSTARGETTPDSDVDLLVVVSESNEPSHRRAQAAYRAVGRHSISLDILVMTREEFDRRARALASLPATVLREGKCLYAA